MEKYVSGATCAAGPALAKGFNQLGDDGVLWVAFPGGGGLGAAAPNYKLNVMPVQIDSPTDSWSFERLLVLENETTSEQPALTFFNDQLWLAWTGTDPAHRLNLLPLTVDSDHHLTVGTKIVFNWTASGGPSLQNYVSIGESALYMAFSGGGGLGGEKPNGALNLVWSADGINWPSYQSSVLNQFHSLRSPSMKYMLPSGNQTTPMCVAFTGTNNLLYFVTVKGSGPEPAFLRELTPDGGEYPETSDYAPALGVFHPSDTTSLFYYVWTGSGGNRHLYCADDLFDAYAEPIRHTAFSDTSAFAPAVVGLNSHRYVAWAGTDNAHRLNICEFDSMTKIEGP